MAVFVPIFIIFSCLFLVFSLIYLTHVKVQLKKKRRAEQLKHQEQAEPISAETEKEENRRAEQLILQEQKEEVQAEHEDQVREENSSIKIDTDDFERVRALLFKATNMRSAEEFEPEENMSNDNYFGSRRNPVTNVQEFLKCISQKNLEFK